MSAEVKKGCLEKGRKDASTEVVVAVTNLAKTPIGSQTRLSCVLHDGASSMYAVFASKMLQLYDTGKVSNGDIISMNRYQVSEVEGKAKMMILDCEVLGKYDGDVQELCSSSSAPAQPAIKSPMVPPSPSEQPRTPMFTAGAARPHGAAMTPGSAMRTPPLALNRQGDNAQDGPTPSLPTADASTMHQPIAGLNPYQNKWTIRVKLESKQPLKEMVIKGEPTSISTMVLVDDAGTQIEGTFWRDSAREMDRCMHEGKIYFVSNGNVQPNNRKWSTVDNDYKISFTDRTKVKQAANQDGSKMRAKLNFVKIDALATKIEKKIPVDIVGVVTSVAPLGSVKRQADGSEIIRRDLTVVDDSRKSVSITLWRQDAEGVGNELYEAQGDHPVVVFTKMRVSDFNGVSVSGSFASRILVNPEGYEAATALRSWWASEGHSLTFAPAGDGAARPGAASRRSEHKALEELVGAPGAVLSESDPPIFATVTVVLMDIPDQQKLYYDANSATNKKVEQDASGSWIEVATGQPAEKMVRRYIMNAKFSDFSSEQQLNIFNAEAEAILKMSADEVHVQKESDAEAFERVLEAPKFSQWVLDVVAKPREYEGKARMRINVRNARPVDWTADAALLASRIQQMCPQ